jgi:hypothetical protein
MSFAPENGKTIFRGPKRLPGEYTGHSRLPYTEYTGESRLDCGEYNMESRLPCDEYPGRRILGVFGPSIRTGL